MTTTELDKLSEAFNKFYDDNSGKKLSDIGLLEVFTAGYQSAASHYEAEMRETMTLWREEERLSSEKIAALEKRVERLREALKKFAGIPTTIILETSMEKHYFADEALQQDEDSNRCTHGVHGTDCFECNKYEDKSE